ncbi:hypothetical protein AMAG_18948 [Allomyces macrogynus ATCC 38327]|uniref:Pre-mRNA-splicing factor 38 n=1 Tax=Allomyces macrogynus (strain ATCC 38327) TaxID=578462 RepID=A0A0L0SKP2_ALLM3|nr:hypothetical protein AMAG_18948 [Allomyces macrogynus ATCC 38327]|eukprot:KNE63092.1 hypothetical protein AMAG_18948 [Allomyces macrogynus ATCC 38327]
MAANSPPSPPPGWLRSNPSTHSSSMAPAARDPATGVYQSTRPYGGGYQQSSPRTATVGLGHDPTAHSFVAIPAYKLWVDQGGHEAATQQQLDAPLGHQQQSSHPSDFAALARNGTHGGSLPAYGSAAPGSVLPVPFPSTMISPTGEPIPVVVPMPSSYASMSGPPSPTYQGMAALPMWLKSPALGGPPNLAAPPASGPYQMGQYCAYPPVRDAGQRVRASSSPWFSTDGSSAHPYHGTASADPAGFHTYDNCASYSAGYAPSAASGAGFSASRTGPSSSTISLSHPNPSHIAPLVEQLRKRRTSQPPLPTVPKESKTTTQRYQWLVEYDAQAAAGNGVDTGPMQPGSASAQAPWPNGDDSGPTGEPTDAQDRELDSAAPAIPSPSSKRSAAAGATAPPRTELHLPAGKLRSYIPYTKRDYEFLCRADQVAKLPTSLGPPGDPETERRRHKVRHVQEYSDMDFEGGLQLKVEKIVRSRIYETLFWKEECFGLTAETIVDKAVELNHIGGQYGTQTPTKFLCLVLKLLQIEPSYDIVLEYIRDPEFKYLRALGAFYLRLTANSLQCYEELEPLLVDYRKLRFRQPTGAYTLTTMDQFVDDLLLEERLCDIILPRIQKRHVLEDKGDLDPRLSALSERFEAEEEARLAVEEAREISDREDTDDGQEEGAVPDEDGQEVGDADIDAIMAEASEPAREPELPEVDVTFKVKISKKKVAKTLFKKSKSLEKSKPEHTQSPPPPELGDGGFRESMSIEETNRMRIAMGMKPLRE